MLDVKSVKEYVQENKQVAINFLVECLQTPSVTGNELEMGKVVTKWIERMGLETENYEAEKDRPNILAEWFGESPGPRFIFNGHMDVFPPVEGDPGLYGPWSGKIVGDYIYGRGAADMKGGLCASIMAVKFLKEMGFDPKGSILLTAVSDEENGSKYGAKYLLDKGLLHGDYGICMDVTRGKIRVSGSGTIGMNITYTSEPAHGSAPHPTMSALQKSVLAINELYKLDVQFRKETYPPFATSSPSSCLSITSLHSGEATNVHPAQSTFSIDCRVVPGKTLEWAYGEIFAVLDKLKEEQDGFEYTYEIEREFPVYKIDPEGEMVAIASAAYEDVMGKPVKLYERSGSSDVHHFINDSDIDMIDFGPGLDYEEVTKANEKLLVEEYLSFIEIYMMTVVRLMG